MIIVIIVLIGISALLASAMWQLACWATRKTLGIPKHPPYYEAKVQQLPWYLDDRVPPPNS